MVYWNKQYFFVCYLMSSLNSDRYLKYKILIFENFIFLYCKQINNSLLYSATISDHKVLMPVLQYVETISLEKKFQL